MMKLGFKGLLLLLAMVLFIVGALTEENRQDILFWGLAIFAASFIVESLPLGAMGPKRDRT
jgi:predicted cobalt transporter CbtA